MKLDKIYLRKIKEDYLKFVKKQESFGDSFKDKLGQLNTFYLPISEKIYKKFIKKKENYYCWAIWWTRIGKNNNFPHTKKYFNDKI